MRPLQSLLAGRIGLTLSAVAAAVLIVDAKVKVEAQADKTFAFASLSTYAWPPDAGTLVRGTSPDLVQDGGLTKEALAPTIHASTDRGLARWGLKRIDDPAQADATIAYYLIGSTGVNASQLGSLYGYTTDWAPPLSIGGGATTSFRAYQQGTLFLDLVDRKSNRMVWRGIASSEIDHSTPQPRRLQLLDEAIMEMTKKLPKRK